MFQYGVVKCTEWQVVISLTALHHCANYDQTMRELVRVGNKRYGLSVLKRSADTAKTERMVNAIMTYFDVIEEFDDIHDYVYVLTPKSL